MEIPRRNSQFVRNGVLRSLSSSDFENIRPFLQMVSLKERSVLQEPNRPAEHVHFFESGLVSLMTLVPGSILETLTVGSQGFDPAPVALGVGVCTHRSVVLVAGSALRIRRIDLTRLMYERPQFHEHLLRYVHLFIAHVSQNALCGVHHQLEKRLASWLCLACDTLDSDVLAMTQDHLSNILGFRRTGVGETLIMFENQGIIKKVRLGVIQVLDRSMLEKKACCCYGSIKAGYQSFKSKDLSKTGFSKIPAIALG